MADISQRLLKEFATITNDTKENKIESFVYGTVETSNGQLYVKIDGSDYPIELYFTDDHQTESYSNSITDVKDGERVMVMIKNHQAVVTGNLSSPAARTKTVQELSIRVNTIETDNVTINNQLNANSADIKTLKSDNATITGKLTAAEADIETLKATSIDVDSAVIRILTTDYATMQEFYAKSGLIKNATIQNGNITGELIGVTIKGDRIIANSIMADKLMIKGKDGLFYKLNYDSGAITGEQVPDDSLHGSVITADSITADKIHVTDLQAFDATIGGFKISDSAIHSASKTSLTSDVLGLYLSKTGEFSFGNATDHIKFIKDSDDDYKLEISGEINANSGNIGGILINEVGLQSNYDLGSASRGYTILNHGFITTWYKGDGIDYSLTLGADQFTMSSQGSSSGSNPRLLYMTTRFLDFFYLNVLAARIESTNDGELKLYAGTRSILLDSKVYATKDVNVIGDIRINQNVIGIYKTYTDALGDTNRKGFIGYTGTGSTALYLSNESEGNIILQATDGNIVLNATSGLRIGNVSGSNKAVYFGSASLWNEACTITRYWADGSAHSIISMNQDGLKTNIGWVGSSTYKTVLNLQGQSIQCNGATSWASDKNLKYDIENFDEKIDIFYKNLKPRSYKYVTGSSGRTHSGFITQEVEEALSIAGLTTKDFAGVTVQPITSREVEMDDDGNIVDVANSEVNYLLDKGLTEQHNLAYIEFIALNTYMIQKLQNEIEFLKEQLKISKGE